MLDALTEIKCTATLKCFMKHWSKVDSVVHIPRTNIIAERGVKLMEDLLQNSKLEYANVKFIGKNYL